MMTKRGLVAGQQVPDVIESAATELKSNDSIPTTEEIHFERLLKVLGYFGKFQVRLFTITCLLDFSASWIMVFYVFANVVPKWKCAEYSGNQTVVSFSNHIVGNSTSGVCKIDGNKCIKFEYNTTDSINSIVKEWDLVCDQSFIPKLTVSIQMAGVLIGALCCGYLAEWVGRKKTLLVYCSGVMIFQVIAGLSVNYYMYIVLRFFIGFCIAGPFCLCYTLPMEFCGPKWRTFVGALSLFGFAPMMLAFFAYYLRNWQHLAFVTGAIFMPAVIAAMIWVPESIRWLTMKGRFEEAEKTIRWMARVNRTQVPDLGLLRALAAQDKSEQEEGKRHNYLDLFCTRELAIQTLTLMYASFCCSTIFYGVSTMYSTFEGTIFMNAILNSCVVMPLVWTAIYSGNRYGRDR